MDFEIILQECFLSGPLLKHAKIVPFHYTKWHPEQEKKKKKKRKIFKQHLLLGQGPDCKIISQKCSSNAPLLNC